jgi:hypothetical protein
MKKNQFFRHGVAIIIVVATVAYLNAFVVFNDIPPVFNSRSTQAMESMTIDGTSSFLRSNADAFLLLNEVEIGYPSNLNFPYALALTESAIWKLEEARGRYQEIISVSQNSNYEDTRIKRLRRFNYGLFAIKKNLNSDVMKGLQNYLGKGDIMGLYLKNIANMNNILRLLTDIKKQLTAGITPPISSFWSLLQQYSDSILLGNYATMVFNQI